MKKVIAEGYEQDGLYYLQYSDQPKVSDFALICDEFVIPWHLHLSHTSLKFNKLLFLSVKVVSKLQYESCQFGKHHRTSISFRVVNHCNSLIEVVHTHI